LNYERLSASYESNIKASHGGLPTAATAASGGMSPGQAGAYVGTGLAEGPMRAKRHILAAAIGTAKAPFRVVDRALANLAHAAKSNDSTAMQRFGMTLMRINVAPAVVNQVIQQEQNSGTEDAPTPG
jgi:hypothetical protein